MAANDFLPFAIAVDADVLSQPDYSVLPAVSTGFETGIAEPAELNKVWRQSSVIASQIAQLIVNVLGVDAADDGDMPTLRGNIGLLLQTAGARYGADTGAVNDITVTLAPALTADVVGLPIVVKIGHTTTSTTPTLNAAGTDRTITRLNGGVMLAGDLLANAIHAFAYDGANYRCLTLPASSPDSHVVTAAGVTSWTVPNGVTVVQVEVVGAGSGAQGGTLAGGTGNGGGGGGCARGVYAVTPGEIITLTNGAGSVGVAQSATSAAGGTTSFGSRCSATGGQATSNGSPGQGGIGTGGTLGNYKGGFGSVGLNTSGGLGGGAAFGGGTAGGGNGAGVAGSTPGGGAAGSGGGGTTNGGTGADGQITIGWGA